MDVTPQTLREVEFREKMRGYHPEDVDAFLERVADGLEVLLERLSQALDRAAKAEQRAAEAGGTDEALRKTLLLAQRTADLAVQEAREQASRILAGAEQQAQGILADAEERARQASDEAQGQLRADVIRLEAGRTQLQADVSALSRWLEDQKTQLSSNLHETLSRIDQLGVLQDPPDTSVVDLPPMPSSVAAPSSPPPGTGDGGGESGRPASDPSKGAASAGTTDSPASRPEPVISLTGNGATAARPPGAREPVGADPGERTAALPQTEPAKAAASSEPAPAAGQTLWAGQPRPADSQVRAPERPGSSVQASERPGPTGRDDPFLAELRRAVADGGPLGPQESGSDAAPGTEGPPAGLYDQTKDEGRPVPGRLWRRH